eukprot:jgi/Orpsp1_1/1174332/evm.model.c7180000049711.1
MKIVFEKELKHWQQQYHILKRHFKNYQIKAKERIEQWKKYSEYIKFENQKLQNEIIAKLPDISRNNIDISMLSDIPTEKNNILNNVTQRKIKFEPKYESSTSDQPSKKRKYSDGNDERNIFSSSPIIKTPSSRIIDGLNVQNLLNSTSKKTQFKREENFDYNNNNNNNINEMIIKPLQRQNSMVLSKEQLKEMSKSKPKEKVRMSNTEGIFNIKKEDNETVDIDLKNAIVQGIDSNKSDEINIVEESILQEKDTSSAESSTSKSTLKSKSKSKSKTKTSEKKKNKKRKKKNILLSPSDKILKELCESSDVELNDSNLSLNDSDDDSDDDSLSDDDSNSIVDNIHDHHQDQDKLKDPNLNSNGDEENQLNSSQRSEEIVKNINTINIGKALINSKSAATVLLNNGKNNNTEQVESVQQQQQQQQQQSIKKNRKSTKPTDNNKTNKKSKSKSKKKRRETIIPETPSIRSESEDENPFSKILNEDSREDEERKVYIWKTNYEVHKNEDDDDNERLNNQKNETTF